VASARRTASDVRLHPGAACLACALTLGIPVYVTEPHAHTGTDPAATVARAFAAADAAAPADH